MSGETKNILSALFAVIGFFFLAVVFNTIDLILGLQAREEGGSSVPAIMNAIFLLMWALSMFIAF